MLQNMRSLKGDYFYTREYLSQSSNSKAKTMWQSINEDKTPAKWPGIKLAGIFIESMAPSFEQPGDTFQSNVFGKPGRSKYIHTVGAIARVNFVSAGGHPFTGIFKGATNGFMRLSSAADPGADNSGLAPGMGLKFLRDGIDSANLVSMFSVDGNPAGDTNFFSQNFWNHIGPASDLPTHLLSAKFGKFTDYI